jgi:TolB protein
MPRILAALAGFALLLLGLWRHAPPASGQAAVSFSLPGQEDLTFWANRDGLDQIDVDGEVGFGDWGRILMRRRANAPHLRRVRDRFVFRDRDFSALETPDLLRPGARYVVAQNRIFNLPALRNGKGYFHRIVENEPGIFTRTIDGVQVAFDVRPLVKLRVRLRDERGRPVAARVYLTASDGLAWAPAGAINRYAALPAEPFFHAEDSFEILLPAGPTVIEATRGIEYKLTRREIDLSPGRPAEIEIRLERWIDMAARGWFSSDAHIHANYTARHHQTITPEDVRLYTAAEDLHYANMMVANSSDAFIHDRDYFQGRPHRLSRGRMVIYWNQEMRNAGLYGHMCLFNLERLVEPLYTGFRDTPQWEDYPPNFDMARRARAQGGAVTYAHPGYAPTLEGASARELPVDLALGEVDALDVLSNNPEEVAMELWYRLLNCGLRLGISAGTDSFTNVADHYTPGGGRVYARVDGRMNHRAWVRAFRHHRTMATNGPAIFLTVQGQEPGSRIHLPAGTQPLRVRAQLSSQIPIDKLELIVNGKVRLSRAESFEETITLDRSAWIALRATGPWNRLVLNDAYAFAHTSPVYVYLGDQPVASAEDARFWMDWIDKLIARTQQRGRFATAERKNEVLALFRRARDFYETVAKRDGPVQPVQ